MYETIKKLYIWYKYGTIQKSSKVDKPETNWSFSLKLSSFCVESEKQWFINNTSSQTEYTLDF